MLRDPTPPKLRGPKANPVEVSRILDAAQEVFSRGGLGAASIRAIARQAGCDPALIYYRFKSKEDLFLTLVQRRLPPLAGELSALSDPADARNIRERLWDVLEAFYRHFGQDSGFRSLFRGQLVNGSMAVKNAVAAHLRPIILQVIRILEQGIARGEVRADLNPQQVAFFFGRMHMEILDLMPSVGHHLTDAQPGEALQDMRQAWLDFAMRAITAQPAPGSEA